MYGGPGNPDNLHGITDLIAYLEILDQNLSVFAKYVTDGSCNRTALKVLKLFLV